MSNEWTDYTDKSLDDATPQEWDKVSKTAVGKLFHPNDTYRS